MKDEALHVGKDGLDLKGNGSILVGVLMMFMAAVGWMFWGHLERDERRNVLIEQRMESMTQEHGLLKHSIDANTEALNGVNKQMELQSYLMLATPKQEAEARALIGIPELLKEKRR